MTKVDIEHLSDEVMKGLKEYAKLSTDSMKAAVKKAGNEVKSDISQNAPKSTGRYAKSWTVKKTKETSDSLELVVHSPTRYRIAHLLEFGHAKRGGGRVSGKPHIKPAEEKAIDNLEKEITRALGG